MDNQLRDEVAEMYAQICKGLADPTRILIVCLLSLDAYSVNELVEEVQLPQPTISRHLKILREKGLVVCQREGKQVFYNVADERIVDALRLLRSVIADRLTHHADLTSRMEQDIVAQPLYIKEK